MSKLTRSLFMLLTALCGFKSNAQTKLADAGAAQIDMRVADPAAEPSDAVICKSVDTPACFPGGVTAWGAFLRANLRYPRDAAELDIQGRVVLSFTILRDGTLSDIGVISGPLMLREEALRVLRLSPKWIPAHKNGAPVASYMHQPISFVLEPVTKPKSDLSEGLKRP